MPDLKRLEKALRIALKELENCKKAGATSKEVVSKPKVTYDGLIILEVGHGGHPEGFEPGAVDPRTGVREWDMNFVCARSCWDELTEAGFTNVKVVDDDDYLRHIGEKYQKAEIFVSVHHNAFSSDQAQGAEALVHKRYWRKQDEDFAALCSAEFAAELGIHNRGIKTMNLSVLEGATRSNVTDQCVVLVEPYFITGKDVDDHKKWSKKAGVALARAIKKHLGVG